MNKNGAYAKSDETEHTKADILSYNKTQATRIKLVAKHLPEKKKEFSMPDFMYSFQGSGISIRELEHEFGININDIVELAYSIEPPNKISLIVECEHVKSMVGDVPTKADMEKYSRLKISQYEKEFESWGDFLRLMSYDPWLRKQYTKSALSKTGPKQENRLQLAQMLKLTKYQGMKRQDALEMLKGCLQDNSKMLSLAQILDENIDELDKTLLEKTIKELD